MGRRYYLTKGTKNLILGILALAYLYFSLDTIIHTSSSVGKPFPGFLLLKNNFVSGIYLNKWEGFQRGIKFGDIILAVNGKRVSHSSEVRALVSLSKPGTPITYLVKRNKQEFELTIPVSLFSLRDYLIIILTWSLIGTSFYLIGLVAFYLKPNLPQSRALLFLSLTWGLSMITNPSYCIDNSRVYTLFFLSFVGPSVLLLSLYFPVELKFRKPVVFLVFATSLPLAFLYIYSLPHLSLYLIIDKIILGDLGITFFLGVALTTRSFIISQDPLVKQRAKIWVYTFVLITVLGGIILFAARALKVMNFYYLPFLVLSFPLGVAYAIVKHNLFDIDVFIRRSAGYLILSLIVIIGSFFLLSGLNLALQMLTGKSSQVSALITIFIVLIVFQPLRSRIDRAIERRFFPEKFEYQRGLLQSIKILTGILEMEPLLNQMLGLIMDTVKIENGCVLLRDQDRGSLKLALSRDSSQKAKIPTEGDEAQVNTIDLKPLLNYLMTYNPKSIQINDLEQIENPSPDQEGVLKIMKQLKLVLFIPIVYEIRMIGILGLGPKKNGAWYSSEDIELFKTLMLQTAVAIENARQVNELKKMVELKISNRELKKINELKDSFLSMVSHDLRTPMTAIKAYAEIMREQIGTLDQEQQKKYLDIILQQSDRLTRLINDLLDIQRFEAGRMEMTLTELELNQLVNESVESFMGLAKGKGLKLEKEVPEGKIIVVGNQDRLQQALGNLLSNALKFSPPNGTIWVGTELINSGSEQQVKVSVSDQGPGIPLEFQGRLFEKFQQLDLSPGAKRTGSGLGLALVKQIIEYHRGKVGVVSEPGKGSTFFFLLPLGRKVE